MSSSTKALYFDLFGRDKSASSSLRRLGGNASSMGKIFSKVGALIGGVFAIEKVVEFGKQVVEVAIDAQKTDTQLSQTLKNVGAAFSATSPEVEDADKKLRSFGFTNEDTNTALNTLTLGLGSPSQALKALSVAADLARAKNMDLNSAALLVTKGMEGQIRPLKALGIDLPVVAGGAEAVKKGQQALATAQERVNQVLSKYPDAANAASKGHEEYLAATNRVRTAQQKLSDTEQSGDKILKTITARTKDAAKVFGTTTAGKVAVLKAKFSDLEEKIGDKVLPTLNHLLDFTDHKIVPGLEKFAKWVSKNKDVLGPASVAVGVLSGAFWVLDAAMDANPVGAVILGIIALIGYVTLLTTNWNTVLDLNTKIFKVMGDAVFDVTDAMASAFDGFFNFVGSGLQALLVPLNIILKSLGRSPITIPTLNIAGYVAGAHAAFDTLANAADGADVVGGKGGSAAPHKKLARGGIALPRRGGVEAVLAEAGTPEVALPLTRSNLKRFGIDGSSRGGGDTYLVTVNGFIGDENRFIQKLSKATKRVRRRGGIPIGAFQ